MLSSYYPDLQFTQFPNSEQTFPLMQDIIAADAVNVKGFQDAMATGNLTLAQQYYSLITDADSKFIDAIKLNTLFQTCVALQRFYQTDVQPYITDKQGEWQVEINKFNYLGAFSPTMQYVVNNWVSSAQADGSVYLYICIAVPPIGTLPTNTTYWRQLTVKGQGGEAGVGLAFVGAWEAGQTYKLDDVVSYSNGVWGALQANSGQVPVEGSAYWRLIYMSTPIVYPVQAAQPTGQLTGDLWFEVTG